MKKYVIIIVLLLICSILHSEGSKFYAGLGIATTESPCYTLDLNMSFGGIKIYMERTREYKFNSIIKDQYNCENKFGLIVMPAVVKELFSISPGIGFNIQPHNKYDEITEKWESEPKFKFIYGGQIIIKTHRAGISMGIYNSLNFTISILIGF